jgi:hypothetical protein
MDELFASGRAMDIVLVVVVVEALMLKATEGRHGLGLVDIVGLLGAGIFLVLGVRAALVGDPWWVTAAWVSASLPMHVFDVTRRVRLVASGNP